MIDPAYREPLSQRTMPAITSGEGMNDSPSAGLSTSRGHLALEQHHDPTGLMLGAAP
jgi:hypothetical protein